MRNSRLIHHANHPSVYSRCRVAPAVGAVCLSSSSCYEWQGVIGALYCLSICPWCRLGPAIESFSSLFLDILNLQAQAWAATGGEESSSGRNNGPGGGSGGSGGGGNNGGIGDSHSGSNGTGREFGGDGSTSGTGGGGPNGVVAATMEPIWVLCIGELMLLWISSFGTGKQPSENLHTAAQSVPAYVPGSRPTYAGCL